MNYEHIHLISEAEVEALRSVLGQCVFILYTRSVEVHEELVVAPNFSLAVGEGREGGYCVIESDWSDTPQEGIDYHMIEVALRDWPKGIARVRDNYSRDMLNRDMLGYPSSLLLRPAAADAVISRIQVLEHREAAGAEAVHYDRALVFTRSDGYRFSLAVQDSIAGGLEFSAHPPIIEDLLREYPERLCIER